MNPDVAQAVPRLVERGILPAEPGRRLERVARGELLSVEPELRLVLYLGVLLIVGGVSLLVKENLDHIGPATIAVGLALAAAVPLVWVVRKAPPFSWGEQSSPHLAFDYMLLLGVLLAGADLAYVEWRFTPLGENWPWHLLLMSLFCGGLALRYDSRTLVSLALSSFAAWRGVAVGLKAAVGVFDRSTVSTVVSWNALGCGVLFVLLGWGLAKSGRKPHFEPVATHLGWLLVLGAMSTLGGIPGYRTVWAALLLVVGAGLAILSFRSGRFSLVALGTIAGYVGLTEVVLRWLPWSDGLGCAWFFWTAGAVVVLLVVAQRRMRKAA